MCFNFVKIACKIFFLNFVFLRAERSGLPAEVLDNILAYESNIGDAVSHSTYFNLKRLSAANRKFYLKHVNAVRLKAQRCPYFSLFQIFIQFSTDFFLFASILNNFVGKMLSLIL